MIISWDEARARGLKRYFTGEACRNGHLAERLVSNKLCCECRSAVWSAFRKRNPVRVARNKDIQNARSVSSGYFRDYYQHNADKRKAQANEWYHANKERALKACKNWADRNRDKVREMGQRSARKRRAIKAAVGGTHTRADLDRIFKQQRGKCALCKCSLASAIKELDHIVPVSRGGDNNPGNLQWLCRPCNRSKSNKDPIEFARERGALL